LVRFSVFRSVQGQQAQEKSKRKERKLVVPCWVTSTETRCITVLWLFGDGAYSTVSDDGALV
jgi:hypothetical protein